MYVLERAERSFGLQIIFLSEQPFYGNYSTLDSHTNTVIFFTRLHTRQDGVENRDKVYDDNGLKMYISKRGGSRLFS